MSDWEARASRASESLAGNEALTADLDDRAADALLEWGRAAARDIARGTAGLDDAAAEAASEPRIVATGRMLRAVARLVAHWEEMEPAVRISVMARIVEQAGIAYDGRSPDLDIGGRADILYQLRDVVDQSAAIHILRTALEPAHDILVVPQGSLHVQEDIGIGRSGAGADEEPSDVDDVADYGAASDDPGQEI